MRLLGVLDRKGKIPVPLHHSTFGTIEYSNVAGCWENGEFELWGFSPVQLLLDAPPSGPSAQQVAAFVAFNNAADELIPRCLAAIQPLLPSHVAAEELKVTSLSIPRIPSETPDGGLWTLWFDREGEAEADVSYGVQTQDNWQTIAPFSED